MMYGANPEQLAQFGRTLHEQMIGDRSTDVDGRSHDRINHMARPGTPTLRAGSEVSPRGGCGGSFVLDNV